MNSDWQQKFFFLVFSVLEVLICLIYKWYSFFSHLFEVPFLGCVEAVFRMTHGRGWGWGCSLWVLFAVYANAVSDDLVWTRIGKCFVLLLIIFLGKKNVSDWNRTNHRQMRKEIWPLRHFWPFAVFGLLRTDSRRCNHENLLWPWVRIEVDKLEDIIVKWFLQNWLKKKKRKDRQTKIYWYHIKRICCLQKFIFEIGSDWVKVSIFKSTKNFCKSYSSDFIHTFVLTKLQQSLRYDLFIVLGKVFRFIYKYFDLKKKGNLKKTSSIY